MTEEALIARAGRTLRRAYELDQISLAEYRAGLDNIRNVDKPKTKKETNHGHLRTKTK